MNLLPALEVLSPRHGVVVQESLGDDGVRHLEDGVVEGGEVLAVPVVGGGPQLQHGPHGLQVVGRDGAVHGGAPVPGPEVQDCSSIDQSHHHPGGPGPDPGYQGERSF